MKMIFNTSGVPTDHLETLNCDEPGCADQAEIICEAGQKCKAHALDAMNRERAAAGQEPTTWEAIRALVEKENASTGVS